MVSPRFKMLGLDEKPSQLALQTFYIFAIFRLHQPKATHPAKCHVFYAQQAQHAKPASSGSSRNFMLDFHPHSFTKTQ